MRRRPSAVVARSALAATAAIALSAVTLGTVAGPASAAVVPAGVAGRVAVGVRVPVGGVAAGTSASATRPATSAPSATIHQVVLPDVFAVAPRGITAAQLAALGKLRYVRNLITVAGGAVSVGGHPVQIIGVSPAQFQSWTPLQTAAMPGIWSALARGGFVTTAAVAKQLGLRSGQSYQVTAARQFAVTFGGTASVGIPGVDAVVGQATSKELGLLPQIGVLISAPGADLATLDAQVSRLLGKQTRFISLRQPKPSGLSQPKSSEQLPVDTNVSSSRPSSYLQLFQDSAALYCKGLSWTVLAAIGQIESADGENEGPSSAGALGPMQFMPSTWSRWGIDAFGETGAPNVMDPYDAVPSAAEYLCAAGAASGGAGLTAAIFAYNHAMWYVDEVLALAQEYAREYG
jgi:Transglycosylase SLT domain